MPWLDYQVGVEYSVHLYRHVCGDGHDGGKVEYPAEEIEGTSEEAQGSAVARTWGHASPVVDAAGGGNGGGELRECQREVRNRFKER